MMSSSKKSAKGLSYEQLYKSEKQRVIMHSSFELLKSIPNSLSLYLREADFLVNYTLSRILTLLHRMTS